MNPIRSLQMRSAVAVATGPFVMSSLFASGEKGGYYDFTDGAKLAVNGDGTGGTPSVGSACKWAIDLSPNNNHLRNTVSSVTRRTNGIETSGTGYGLYNLPSLGHSWANLPEPYEIICCLEQISYAGADRRILAGDANGTWYLLQGAATGEVRFYAGGYGNAMAAGLGTEFTVDGTFAGTGRQQSLNGGALSTSGVGNTSISGIALGSTDAGNSPAPIRFKRMLIIGRVLTSVERAGAYAWASV